MEELKDKDIKEQKRKPIWKDGIVMVLIVIFGFSFFAKDTRQPIEYRPPTASIVTRSLNTGTRISIYRDAFVSYSVQITSNLTLSGGQSGTVNLQTSPDNSTWTTIATQINNNTGALTLGLSTSNVQSGSLTGFVPAGYYVRMATSGTSTMVYVSGMEVQL